MKNQLLFKSFKTSIVVFIFFLFINIRAFSQGSVILSVNPDNCMNPVPNSGTYTPNGTLNGKTAYFKNANLRIVWTGTAWEVMGDDPGIGGVTWVTGWNNLANTPKPPDAGWVANFGCFPITLTGDVSSPSTSTEDIPFASDLVFSSIYPNPTTGKFTLIYQISSANYKELTIEAYDLLGNKVLQSKISEQALIFNIEKFKRGIYWVRVIDVNSNTVYSQRLIKN